MRWRKESVWVKSKGPSNKHCGTAIVKPEFLNLYIIDNVE